MSMMHVVPPDDGEFDEFMVALRNGWRNPGRQARFVHRQAKRQCRMDAKSTQNGTNDLVPQPVKHAGQAP